MAIICTRPMILPMDSEGRIYVLENEQGKIIGSGPREACEMLLKLITSGLNVSPESAESKYIGEARIRSASSL